MSENGTFIPKDEVAFLGNWTFLRDVLDHVNPKFDVEFNGDGPGGRLGLPYNKFTDLKCLRCSKFGKLNCSRGVLN